MVYLFELSFFTQKLFKNAQFNKKETIYLK